MGGAGARGGWAGGGRGGGGGAGAELIYYESRCKDDPYAESRALSLAYERWRPETTIKGLH